jgi:hypothetical protein
MKETRFQLKNWKKVNQEMKKKHINFMESIFSIHFNKSWNILLLVISTSTANDTSELPSTANSSCFPSISIFKAGIETQGFCLNTISDSKDSCKDLTISFQDAGIRVLFHRNNVQEWIYVGAQNQKENQVPVEIKVSVDQRGLLRNASINFDLHKDTTINISDFQRYNESPCLSKDTSGDLKFVINESTYWCGIIPINAITEKFTLGAGYMVRGQVLNHPQLAMHHYGFDRQMPLDVDVWEYSLYAAGYRILNPPKLKYANLKVIDKKEAAINKHRRNRSKKIKIEQKKNGLFQLKPL